MTKVLGDDGWAEARQRLEALLTPTGASELDETHIIELTSIGSALEAVVGRLATLGIEFEADGLSTVVRGELTGTCSTGTGRRCFCSW